MTPGDDWIDEGPSDEDLDEFGQDTAATTMPCPECGAEMYDESERCPTCGQYVTRDTNEWASKPLWWILLAIAGVVALVWALL